MKTKKHPFFYSFLFVFAISLVIGSCKKDTSVTYTGNDAPYYDGIPKVKVENYINRLFIDLIGREPLDAEMIAEEDFLRSNDFSISSREQLITKLQTDTNWIVGDTSYKHAYYNRYYEMCKARVLEAASDEYLVYKGGLAHFSYITDSLAGDTVSMRINLEIENRCYQVVRAQKQYRLGTIEIKDVFARMLYNSAYDQINMNTFNFVNACFDNLLMRAPIQAEFDAGYNMIEYSMSQILFGKSGQNKGDFINVIVNSDEFYEGLVRWSYKTLMAREPSGAETNRHMQSFFSDHNIQKLQKDIMKTDEYANF